MFKESSINARRDEILNACAALYQTYSFREITIKDISQATSLSRPSMYNYFQTKEEIFLALFQREYENWNEELKSILDNHDSMDKNTLASSIAHSIENRVLLLKLLSVNMYDMEENSRLEQLVSFKKSFKKAVDLIDQCLQKFCPDMNDARREKFSYLFFPFMFGIYPYSFANEKQRAAIEQAEWNYIQKSVYELTFDAIQQMLK